MQKLAGRPVDLVISDMAPNISGMSEIDQPRAMHLVELAVDFAESTLKPGGSLLMKVFQGEGFEELLCKLRTDYTKVLSRKPDASKSTLQRNLSAGAETQGLSAFKPGR